MARSFLALFAALFAVSFVPSNAPADDLPHPDIDYIATQLAYMSSNYLMRYSGFDGDPRNPSDPANQPPQVNGWQEFFQYWKDQLRKNTKEFGTFAKAGAIADHYFDVSEFGAGNAPNQGDVPVLTIPGASCPGQSTLVASHPDSTPGLNTGNGSTYDDTSGVTMGMGETAGLAKWWDTNGTWPARTYKLGLFDAEEVGLEGSYFYAHNLLPKGPQGQYVLVANMDQNGLEYPAYPLGNTQTTWNPGPWVTNVNASPVKDYSLSDYNDGHGGPNAAIAANMPAIQRFRTALAQSISQAFADQGLKYHGKVPLQSGTAPAYGSADIAKYYRLQDDTLGRTDQVPFVAQGIPGYGVLGAYDSNADDNPLGATPLSPLGDGSIFGIPQVAGYDTPRDNVEHFNLMTQGDPSNPTSIDPAGRQALDLPATWTSYLLARPEYSGAAPRPTAPIAYFEALPTAPKPGDKIAFDARASVDPAGKGLTYLWDFGDGTTATGAQPQHAYANAGWYSPILVVRDAAGNEVGYQQSIDVGDTKDPQPATDPCGLVASSKAASVAADVVQANPQAAAPAGAGGSVTASGGSSVACAAAAGFRRVSVTARGRTVRFSIARARRERFSVEVFQASRGNRVVANRRVFHRTGLTGSLTWRSPKSLPAGDYFTRVTMQLPGGRHDVRRSTLHITHARARVVASHYRRESCGVLGSYKLSSPDFGGATNAALGVSYRLGRDVDAVSIDVLRGHRVVRRLASAGHELARVTYRARVAPAGLAKGLYRVRLTLRFGGRTLRAEVTARRI